jgi:protein-S-isoprenylcysteine O-methyltransferase Ste14
MVIAVMFWYFFLLICPVLTVAALVFVGARASTSFRSYAAKMILSILFLALVVGPVYVESAGFMPWWDAPLIAKSEHVTYYIVEYALACGILYAIGAPRVRLREDK